MRFVTLADRDMAKARDGTFPAFLGLLGLFTSLPNNGTLSPLLVMLVESCSLVSSRVTLFIRRRDILDFIVVEGGKLGEVKVQMRRCNILGRGREDCGIN